MPTISEELEYKIINEIDSKNLMSYSGSRILHYNEKNYNVMGNRLICSSPQDGSIIWSAEIKDAELFDEDGELIKNEDKSRIASMPIVADRRIIISTRNGKIQIYDPNNGKMLQETATGKQFYSSPIVHNGWIYSGTLKGNVISINTKNKNFTGWNSWANDATHNTVVD